jgi:cell division septum initiation protein DivIVA
MANANDEIQAALEEARKAREEADRVRREAKLEADRVRREAKLEAERLREDARRGRDQTAARPGRRKPAANATGPRHSGSGRPGRRTPPESAPSRRSRSTACARYMSTRPPGG